MLVYSLITQGILLELKDTEITVSDLKEKLKENYFYYKPEFARILDLNHKILKDSDIVRSEKIFTISLFNEIFKKNLEFYGPKIFNIEYSKIKKDFEISEIEFQKVFEIYSKRRYPEINSVVGKVTVDNLNVENVFQRIKYLVPGIYYKGTILGNIKADPKWITDNTIYINWTFNCKISISKYDIKFIFKDSKFKIDNIYFDILLFLEIAEKFNVLFGFKDIILSNFSTVVSIPWINSNIKIITDQLKNKYLDFYNYNLSSDSIHVIPKFKDTFSKIIIHKGPGIRIEIKGVDDYNNYSFIFDFVLNLLIDLENTISENILKSNSSDCQKGRQPNLILGTNSKNKSTLTLNAFEKVSCETSDYKYPGYTKKGTPCCFKNENHSLKFEIFGKENYFEFVDNICFISKEQESEKISSNVFILHVDLTSSKNFTLENSDYSYDIYDTFTFYLNDSLKKTWYKLRTKDGNTKFDTSFGFKLDIPRISGLFYYKDFKKTKNITGQIVDPDNNCKFLIYKDTLIPVKNQQAIKGLTKEKLFIVDKEKQRKTCLSLKLEFKESENWILLSDTLIKIPISEFGFNELIELEKEIFEI